MRTMCIEICFEWLSSMDQATKLEFVVEMLQLRRLLDKTVAAHPAPSGDCQAAQTNEVLLFPVVLAGRHFCPDIGDLGS